MKRDQKSHRQKELDRNRAGLGELHHWIGVIEHIPEQEIKALAGRIKRPKRNMREKSSCVSSAVRLGSNNR
ncbi:AGAP008299-PA-like protein [Anopheles sinensis]|uniref:AGAP008299-PA-like protein n=1 Tax=Anopheles sinensis TaxID=74873 RepID=A0A084VIZ6_ANOSI|nr:AGAP008299-PA-like protein [Anopheles sinensis]